MSYRISTSRPLRAEYRRICLEQITKALKESSDESLALDERVHQVRKRCKKIRGLLRLFRFSNEDLYHRENRFFRDVARQLSALRDCKVVTAAYDGLINEFGTQLNDEAFATVRQRLTKRLQATAKKSKPSEQLIDDFRAEMEESTSRVATWPPKRITVRELTKGFKKTYSRGRKAMKSAYKSPSPENFHQWRKRVKYHWYHARLIRNTWPAVLGCYAQALHGLSNLLGEEHDLTVLCDVLLKHRHEFEASAEVEVVLALAEQRRHSLQQAARPLGQRLFADKPKHLAAHIAELCAIWGKK